MEDSSVELYLAGEMTTFSSQDGACLSGRLCAAAVIEDLAGVPA